MIKPMGKRFTLRLSEELLRKVEQRAEKEGRSIGDVIREALEREFKRDR
jgi:predicted DNA binding CopG/RHH family protein